MEKEIEEIKKLKKLIEKLRALLEAGKLLTSTLNLKEVLERSASTIEQIMGFKHFIIYLKEKEGRQLIPCKWKGYAKNIEKEKLNIEEEKVITQVDREGKSLIALNIDGNVQGVKDRKKFRPKLIVPIIFQKQVIGVMKVRGKDLNFFTSDDKILLETLASQIGIAVNNARLYEEKSKLAMFDSLTNLYNRDYFDKLLRIELSKSKRQGTDLSLLLIDINNLKYINDHWGHCAGDEVLRELARILKNNMRETDIVARYAGDEIAIILPATNREQAGSLVKRIKGVIEKWNQQNESQKFFISVSIGQATTDGKLNCLEIITQADREMYEDKRRYHRKKDKSRGLSILP